MKTITWKGIDKIAEKGDVLEGNFKNFRRYRHNKRTGEWIISVVDLDKIEVDDHWYLTFSQESIREHTKWYVKNGVRYRVLKEFKELETEMLKEDIEDIDMSLQEYIRNTFHYICHLKDMKEKAEALRTHIHDFKVLQKEEMIKSIEEEYNALTRLICKGYKE